MGNKKKENDIGSFFYSLIKRFTIFLFLFQTVMLTLYYSGNFQSFQDSSLRIILFCASLAAVMLFSFSTIGIISSVVMALSRKRPGYVLGSLIYVILDVLAAAVFISLRGLAVLTSGIR